MSLKYDEYIEEHKDNVSKAYAWMLQNLPELFIDPELRMICTMLIESHDDSKYDIDEYDAYDAYFYGNKSHAVVRNFNYAWLNHIHNNEHHWQHWVLINDDPKNGEIILDMPDERIIEMICDWWSFSFKKGNLREIFTWYDENKKYMKMSEYTRDHVEDILNMIKSKLDDVNE